MSGRAAPPEIAEAAERRANARADRDWATADRLRDEIESAGWRVVDRGTAFRLEPARPPDEAVGGEIRYGRSESVPSRLADRDSGPATVVLLASPVEAENRAAVAGLAPALPPEVDLIVVADAIGDAAVDALDTEVGDRAIEIVRTSGPLGRGAALNIGLRRSSGAVVVVLDPSVTPAGDVVTPLVAALDDPTVAVAGPFGLTSTDLRHFDEVTAGETARGTEAGAAGGGAAEAAAIEGYLMAFRRADAAARGPLDESFRFYRNLDIWWSLVLRDEGEGQAPRRALVVPGLALARHEPRAWTHTRPAERDRLSKRNFYRILDRFRSRLDLAAP